MLDAANLLAYMLAIKRGEREMAKSVYKARRRQIMATLMSARRCKLPVIVRRYQNELVSLRIAAMTF